MSKPPTSLRVARTLLYLAAGFAFAPPFMIFLLSQEPLGALPYVLLFFLTAAAFFVAAHELAERPSRARLLAVASAFALAALGTITGFSLGMITFPGAAVGVLAAWAALLVPPRRAVAIAFIAYVAIGILVALTRGGFAFVWTIPTALIWPIWLFLVPGYSILPIYLALAAAAVFGVRAFVRPRAFAAEPTAGWMRVALMAGLVTGAAAVAAFVGWAYARPDTSARFELGPLVLGLVFIGGVLLGVGAVTLRLAPSTLTAVGLGLGATLLFVAFSYGPAVTCQPNGTSQRTPLAWALTSFGGSTSSSGSGGSTMGGGSDSRQSGEFNYGGRRATFRCEGATVVDYREAR